MTASPRTTWRNLTTASSRRASSVTKRTSSWMTARAKSLAELPALPLNAPMLLGTSRLSQWQALTFQALLVFLEPEEKKQPSLKISLLIPRAGDQALKVPRPRLIPRLKRRTSGLPSRSSTLYFTTRNRSRRSCATAKERDWLRRS